MAYKITDACIGCEACVGESAKATTFMLSMLTLALTVVHALTLAR